MKSRNPLDQKKAAEKMSGFHIPFQQEAVLSLEQEALIAEKLLTIYREIIAFSKENSARQGQPEMMDIRYTLLMTPPELQQDTEKE